VRDLLIITPTRKRKDNAQRLIDEVAATATAQTDLVLAVDWDDDSYAGLSAKSMPGRVRLVRGPRRTCIEWTNILAADLGSEYRALASFGDDHAPETPGWDGRMLAAIDDMGGTGIVYGADTLQNENLPTAPVISSDIPAALEWLMYPKLGHFFADNVWKDIAEEAGCLRYLPQVTIRHYHFAFGTAPADSTYIEAAPAWQADEPAYWAWRRSPDGMAAAVEKVRQLCRRGAS
jgi:hypothetical protein